MFSSFAPHVFPTFFLSYLAMFTCRHFCLHMLCLAYSPFSSQVFLLAHGAGGREELYTVVVIAINAKWRKLDFERFLVQEEAFPFFSVFSSACDTKYHVNKCRVNLIQKWTFSWWLFHNNWILSTYTCCKLRGDVSTFSCPIAYYNNLTKILG